MLIGLYTAELNFEILREIGQEGKNSQVFLAYDKQLGAKIVVKKIVKEKLLEKGIEFYREAKILYASTHPYVVRVNYSCSDKEHIYIAMPYYSNGSLKQLIDKRFLTIREGVRYSIQFLSGLNNIHSKGLLHFDVKPDNILISDSNEALLSDFGLSKAMDDFGFANPEEIYSKQLPPEALESTNKTIHFDVYSAGLTIYRLLNGNHHYNSQLKFATMQDYKNAVLQGKFPSRDSYLPHIPLKLQRIVNKALSVNIVDRHQSVLELINELSTVDENLDWQYSRADNVDTWTKILDDKTYEINLDFSEKSVLKQTCYKTMHSSKTKTKVNGHTNNKLTSSNVMSSLKKAFRDFEK